MTAISANQLFSRLPAPVQAALLPHLRIVEVRRGDVLVDDQKPVTQIGFPLTCVARIDAPMGDGRYAHTGILGRHHMAGTHVVHLQPYAPRRVTVLLPGYIAICSVEVYRNQYKRSAALRDTIVWLQMQAHRRIGQLAACNTTHDLRHVSPGCCCRCTICRTSQSFRSHRRILGKFWACDVKRLVGNSPRLKPQGSSPSPAIGSNSSRSPI